MDFEYTTRGPSPHELHFLTLRDRISELAPYMKNAVSVDVRSTSQTSDGTVLREALWRGSMEAVPAISRPMVRPEMLQWLEKSTWRQSDLTSTWDIHLPGLPQLFTARGFNRYLVGEDGGTQVEIQGQFTAHPEALGAQVQSVPGPMLALVVARLERFVVELLDPNLSEQHRAVHLLLDASP